ncbi:MAG: acyl-CoA dehydrogenase family protein [Deltaproteobacteria bacterium]|nr:acyl-CoA dehydrogenase family protein [Deltaproteobacteria bacterium]
MAQPASSNFFLDNDDLRFQLSRIDWDVLVDLQERMFQDPDRFQTGAEAKAFYDELLTSLGEFAAKEIAPFERELDEQHPHFHDGVVDDAPRLKTIFDALAALGTMGLTLPRRLGGLNAPNLISNTLLEMITRADASVAGHFGFYGGMATALMFYSADEGSVTYEGGIPVKSRFDEQITRIIAGKEWGAMVLTEPQAGSDLARLKAKAVVQKDGTWRLNGQKIYITAGHGEHHVVIARSEDEGTHPGLKGMSLFYVPAHIGADGKACPKDAPDAKPNLVIGGIEHKMGQHSAVAATIHYENSYAELIGDRGEGFRLMLVLMNNARIIVAFEALGTCEAAFRTARAYAEERVSMGKTLSRHEMIADYLDEMDVVIRGLRAVTFEAAFHEECGMRIKTILKANPPANGDERNALDKKAKKHTARARTLTPLIKYWGGEEAVRQTRMCMQILGGIGYITETGAEKLLRDALVIPVYEGTSQIQALMALKDNLQAAIKNPARFARDVAETRILALSSSDPLEKGAARMKMVTLSAMQTIVSRIAADKLGGVGKKPITQWRASLTKEWDPAVDFSFGLLHAERLTKLLTWSHTAEVLAQQARSVAGTADADERAEIAQRFIERFEPRAKGVLIEIEATSGSLLQRLLGRTPKKASSSSKAAAE